MIAALVVLQEPQVHGTPPRLQHCMSYDTLLGELKQLPQHSLLQHLAIGALKLAFSRVSI